VLNCAPVVSPVLALAQSCMLNHVKPCTFPNVLSRRPILDLSSRTNSIDDDPNSEDGCEPSLLLADLVLSTLLIDSFKGSVSRGNRALFLTYL
jgi:hypothetical protein